MQLDAGCFFCNAYRRSRYMSAPLGAGDRESGDAKLALLRVVGVGRQKVILLVNVSAWCYFLWVDKESNQRKPPPLFPSLENEGGSAHPWARGTGAVHVRHHWAWCTGIINVRPLGGGGPS